MSKIEVGGILYPVVKNFGRCHGVDIKRVKTSTGERTAVKLVGVWKWNTDRDPPRWTGQTWVNYAPKEVQQDHDKG